MSNITLWIPVIGTLSGAIVGFGTSFITAWWNAKKNSEKASQDRTRQNLEEIYKTLITVKSEYMRNVGNMINKVHNNIVFEFKTDENIPPLVKLEMLINLYAKDLKPSFLSFEKAKNEFGKLLAEVLTGSYTSFLLAEKQKISFEITKRYSAMEEKILEIQDLIAKNIKP